MAEHASRRGVPRVTIHMAGPLHERIDALRRRWPGKVPSYVGLFRRAAELGLEHLEAEVGALEARAKESP